MFLKKKSDFWAWLLIEKSYFVSKIESYSLALVRLKNQAQKWGQRWKFKCNTIEIEIKDIRIVDLGQPNILVTLLWPLETVQDFLIKLDIKPLMHLLEISIFSLNNDLVRLTKIMNNLVKDLKIMSFKVIF